jgi:hypothetical protein
MGKSKAIPYTVSVDHALVQKFKRVCRARGRSQSFYVTACLRRVVESAERSAPKEVAAPAGEKKTRTRRRAQDRVE